MTGQSTTIIHLSALLDWVMMALALVAGAWGIVALRRRDRSSEMALEDRSTTAESEPFKGSTDDKSN